MERFAIIYTTQLPPVFPNRCINFVFSVALSRSMSRALTCAGPSNRGWFDAGYLDLRKDVVDVGLVAYVGAVAHCGRRAGGAAEF